ncbi:MAG: tRNA nucleotidyltransferase, partial [Chloroflexi bacterium]|nr:tRNA nucleotidyltransferase [Chloroflexota bacterium]
MAIPSDVLALIEALRAAGHAAWVVGGSLRDNLVGRTQADWDMATDARPERIVELFPGAVYENRFGTVAVRRGEETFEITTFRSDHDYADFRRPHRVEFGEAIEVDLARRDFTVNAMAWGGRPGEPLGLVDPYGGRADLDRGLLRAVGEPEARFGEDALRMIRAVRLGATLGFAIEPATLAAIEARADLVRHLSGERIAAELE